MTETMSKAGVKRKTMEAEEEDEYLRNAIISPTTIQPFRKRVKATHPERDDHPQEPRCHLEDLWKAAFPFGIEWDELDSVHNKYKWDFSNLEQAFETTGILHQHIVSNKKNKFYLFSQTETVGPVVIPTIVAVVSPSPPSCDIAIRTAGNEFKEIAPMKKLKLDWIPYSDRRDHFVVEREMTKHLHHLIFVLGCTQRRAALKSVQEERFEEYKYCMPYVFNPKKEKEELELELSRTEANITFIPKIFNRKFDWDFLEVEEFAERMVFDEALFDDQKDVFIRFVEEEVRKEKRRHLEKREMLKTRLEGRSFEEATEGFENMRFYKFYPQQIHDSRIMIMNSSINYYYGKAHEVL